MKKEIKKRVVILAGVFLVGLSLSEVMAGTVSGYKIKENSGADANMYNHNVIATTSETPNEFNGLLGNKIYQEAWGTMGCSKEAWEELQNSYNSSMNEYKAKSQPLDSRIFDGVKNPIELTLAGFEEIGCDLSGSFNNLTSLYKTARTVMDAYNSGDWKGALLSKLGNQAIEIARKKVLEESSKMCAKVKESAQKFDGNFSKLNEINAKNRLDLQDRSDSQSESENINKGKMMLNEYINESQN